MEGNELVDREAKEAAKGHALDTKQLPPYLGKPLLINPGGVDSELANPSRHMLLPDFSRWAEHGVRPTPWKCISTRAFES